jgi:hypothetical protein
LHNHYGNYALDFSATDAQSPVSVVHVTQVGDP